MRCHKGVVLFFTWATLLPVQASIRLPSLSLDDPELRRMREEVTQNLRTIASGQTPHIRWRYYRLRKKDTFFSVMARTVLNHDTISSVNRLASLWDVRPGDEWLLPNARGIAVYGERNAVAQKFHRRPETLIPVPGKPGLWFITGLHFDPEEKEFLNLRAFVHPVRGKITSGFGLRRDPFTEKHRFHKGIDIACPIGTPVVASAEGTVIFTGSKKGYGKTVVLEHRNGYQTLYGHLDRILVKPGDKVKQGEKIALSGTTGRSTGPHLHFEVRRRGQPERPNFHLARL
ncbi:MAG: M23 family metallopeptidase [Turneriella sp.]|nr:M23 family metallopeptidase [Leptospiraceae bacterium]MCX7632382.1 M23 family metallopeptidase [Turneriella sp.]